MLEFKRSLNSKLYIFTTIIVSFCFIIGYLLLTQVDKSSNPPLVDILFSEYQVVVSLGALMFPIVIITYINNDYRDKNILFLKKCEVTPVKYYIQKVLVLMFWFTISTIIVHIIVFIIYKLEFNLSLFISMVLANISAILYLVIITSTLSFIFSNVIAIYALSVLIWIASAFVKVAAPTLTYVAYFDPESNLFIRLQEAMTNNTSALLQILESYMYNLGLVVVGILIVLVFKDRWVKNGIK